VLAIAAQIPHELQQFLRTDLTLCLDMGFGRNAGTKRHYYRVAIPLSELWPGYAASYRDTLHVEIFETWLEGN
jgi:hypothetical protein